MTLLNKASTERERERISVFDGIRGWMALTVLFSHVVNIFSSLSFLRETPLSFFIDGAFAVYVFFVLSGIVLSIGYFKHDNIFVTVNLTIKRIPRLGIPVFIACIILIFLMKNNLLFNVQAGAVTGSTGWLSTFFNFHGNLIAAFKFSFYGMFFSYHPDISYNPALWTMSGELFGSFLVLLILSCIHFSRSPLAIIIIFSIFCYHITPIYFCFCEGILISYLLVKHKSILLDMRIYMKFIIFFIFIYNYKNSLHISTIEPVLFVILSVSIKTIRELFTTSFFQFLGKISFPLYIIHMYIICSLSSFLIIWFGLTNLSIYIISILTIILSIVCAYCFCPVDKFGISMARRISSLLLKY